MYVDDCVAGTLRLMESDVREALNIGSDQVVTVNELVDQVEAIAGVKLNRKYKLDAPRGVRGRSSDNVRAIAELGWSPSVGLAEGLAKAYAWIRAEMVKTKDTS